MAPKRPSDCVIIVNPQSSRTTEILPAETNPSIAVKVFDLIRQPVVRMLLLLWLHLSLFSAIYAFAYFARFNFQPSATNVRFFWETLGPVVITKIGVFYLAGHFHGWWRYVTFADLTALLKVSMLSMVVVAFVDYFLLPFGAAIPRLAILLDTLTTILVVGGLRSTWRLLDELLGRVFTDHQREPSLLIGTDHRTGHLASQINSNRSMSCRIVGLLATAGDYRRRAVLGGVRVVGHADNLIALAEKYEATNVLIPCGELSGTELREVIDQCNGAGLRVRVIPKLENAIDGNEEIPLRPLNITDLLRRDPVEIDLPGVETLLKGKRVMVTGAGGSIGAEICRQCLRFEPTELILLGRGENRIHAIWKELELEAETRSIKLRIEIGDITDVRRMDRLFSVRKPEIVFHAAAHKHVPLMELHPGEAVKNNVYGTKVVAELADKYKASHFVMVSTDKAVNPTSIMGCCKQLAERVVYELAQQSSCRFSTVRFGNVLGSAGSVIPIFQEQIRRGGPVTVTDARMTRYFMSIPEASQLVIQAAAQCKGGEIFVLDMGEPVKIVQLAHDLIALSGLPQDSIDIVFSGVRPGEKLYEELYFGEEATIETSHSKVRAAYAQEFQEPGIGHSIDQLILKATNNDPMIREVIFELVPSYQRIPGAVDAQKRVDSGVLSR